MSGPVVTRPSRRRRSLQLATALCALAMLALPGPSTATTATSAFFLDGWRGLTRPGVTAFVGPDNGTVIGYVDRPEHLYVEVLGPDGSAFGITVLAPAGEAIGVGTYMTGTRGSFLLTTNQADPCGQTTTPGSITIDEYVVNNGLTTQLAASFDAGCDSNPPVPALAHGIIRINSSLPFTAIQISPSPRSWAQGHDFGLVGVGADSDTFTTVVTNQGTMSIDVGASISGDAAFALEPGACAGTLETGASCDLAAHFAPATPGAQGATLHLLTPALPIADRGWALQAKGTQATSLTLTVDTDAFFDQVPGAARYTITASPVEAKGWYAVDLTCGGHLEGAYPGPGDLWIPTGPGPCTATAEFTSANGWLASTSPPVNFTMPTRSRIDLWTSTLDDYVPGALITVHADVLPANGAAPHAGSVTIVDETTGVTLGSGSISDDDHSVEVSRDDFTGGMHHLQATYSGGDGISGSTASIDREIYVDTSPPYGQLQAPPYTNDPVVWVRTSAYDLPVNVVTTTRISNDGVHWDERPWTPEIEAWSVIDPASGGVDADGTHTIYASYRDRAGNWTPVLTFDVVLDRGYPVASEPSETIASGGALVGESLPVTLAWSASDDLSGIDHAVLQQSADGGTWKNVKPDVAGSTTRVGVPSAHDVRFRIVAVDKASNATTGADGTPFRVTETADGSGSLAYGGRWHVDRRKSYVDDKAHYTTAKGATVSLRVTGRGFAWIGSRGKASGSAKVFVDGRLVRIIDAHAKRTTHQRLLFTASWTSVGTHRITIKALGTHDHARVDVDAFFSWR